MKHMILIAVVAAIGFILVPIHAEYSSTKMHPMMSLENVYTECTTDYYQHFDNIKEVLGQTVTTMARSSITLPDGSIQSVFVTVWINGTTGEWTQTLLSDDGVVACIVMSGTDMQYVYRNVSHVR